MSKLFCWLIVFLHVATPTLLRADLYLPAEGAPSSTIIEEFSTVRKWDSPDPGVSATVSYSFVTVTTAMFTEGASSGTLTPLANFMPTGALDEIRDAFDAWSAVSDITFTEVADSGNNYNTFGDADIRIAGHDFDGAFGTLAHAATSSFGTSPLNTIAISWIDFDVAENWTVDSINLDNSTLDIFQVAAHEIGHSIGLSHETTLTALMNPTYTETFEGLLADDIDGAQYLYGVSAVPEPSAFLFGCLVCCALGRKHLHRRCL